MSGITYRSLLFLFAMQVHTAILQQTITMAVLHVLFIDNFPQIKESIRHGEFILNLHPSKLKRKSVCMDKYLRTKI
jgi:hypothetical protein